MTPCRTFKITTSEGKTIALGAISPKQAEHFMLAMRPDIKIAMIEEIKPLPDNERFHRHYLQQRLGNNVARPTFN
jgi:hypothetical protein